MNYLLDTHTLLWIFNNDPKLSRIAEAYFMDSDNRFFVSIASVWEIVIKVTLDKLTLGPSIEDFIQIHLKSIDVHLLPIQLKHLISLENLPLFHRDLFDRMIISQAITENMTVISSDKTFDQYPINRVW